MASLDEELLAVAGCTGKGRAPKRRPINDAPDLSSDEEVESSSGSGRIGEDYDSDDPVSRNNPSRVSRLTQDVYHDEDDADSELSFGSDLYKDETDRTELAALPELRREMILLDRGDRLQDHKKRKTKRAQERAEKARRQEMAAVPRLSTQRATSQAMAAHPSGRSRVLPGRKEKAEILNNLVALKQSKNKDRVSAQKKSRFEVENRTPSSSSEDERDVHSHSQSQSHGYEGNDDEVAHKGDSSESEFEQQQKRVDRESSFEEVTFEDILSIAIRRSKLAKWLSEPYFEDIIVGCFVRLGVGGDSPTGYRLCQVRGIEAGDLSRMYKLENRMTHKYISCAFGDEVFTSSMSRVSEGPPQEEEFEDWQEEVRHSGSELLTKEAVAEKLTAIKKVGDFIYSADAVKRMLEEKKMTAARPFNLAAEKDRVARELALAEQQPWDVAEIGRLQAQLRQLEALGAQRRAKDAKAIALAEMNRRNREENFRNASARRVLEAGQDGYDPFSRRWTRSQNYYSKAPAPQAKPTAEPPVTSTATADQKAAQKEAADAGKLVDTAPPPTQLRQLHRFELPLDLSRLQKFGGGSGGAALAFLANRQRIEASNGPRMEAHNPRAHPLTLTINDYKRRMNLID